MADQPPPPGRDDRRALDDLGRRIERARGPETAGPSGSGGATPPSGLAAALRLSTELVAGVVVGAGLGYFFDRFVGTSPFGLIGFILVGFAAGTFNLVRAAARPGRRS